MIGLKSMTSYPWVVVTSGETELRSHKHNKPTTPIIEHKLRLLKI